MTDGEIRKVDKETKKITIKHGEITNLDMPGRLPLLVAASYSARACTCLQ